MKFMRSTEAVTTFFRVCLNAAMAAASSMYLSMAPPKTLPSMLASVGIIILVVTVSDSEAGRLLLFLGIGRACACEEIDKRDSSAVLHGVHHARGDEGARISGVLLRSE